MLRSMVAGFRLRVAATGVLVLVEAGLELLFPLFIGLAIDGLIDDRLDGVVALGLLGLAALIVGSGRRFFDTRTYAAVYERAAGRMVAREQERGTPTSTVAARTSLLGELVEFLENSMPEIISATIGTLGMLVIIAGLDIGVFLACLGLLALMLSIYWLSGDLNLRFNRGYNDELEAQVDAIDSRDPVRIGRHFSALMRWNRRLSDLETVNYIVIWLGIIALLVFTPIAIIEPGTTEYGRAFAAILYVFQFVEALVTLPLFIQQAVRLKEISTRLTIEPDSPPVATG